MAKRKVAAKRVSSSKSTKMSPVIQFGVVFIVVAALAMAYYAGMMH